MNKLQYHWDKQEIVGLDVYFYITEKLIVKILNNNMIGFISSFNFILTLKENEGDFPKFNILNPDFDYYE